MSSLQRLLLCNYHYDPLDRLISHAQPEAPAHQRYYCNSRLATEIQGSLRRSIVQQGDLLLAQQQRQGDAVDTSLLATDPQRSVLQTLKKNHQRQSIAYSPYGHRHGESGLSSLLGYNGERPDPVTGHYLLGNGYRAFNPVLMRFNSPDSWSPFGKGGLNPYGYCEGNPVGRNDPTGHFLRTVIQRLLGALGKSKNKQELPEFFGYTARRKDSVMNIIKRKDTRQENGLTVTPQFDTAQKAARPFVAKREGVEVFGVYGPKSSKNFNRVENSRELWTSLDTQERLYFSEFAPLQDPTKIKVGVGVGVRVPTSVSSPAPRPAPVQVHNTEQPTIGSGLMVGLAPLAMPRLARGVRR